MAPDRFGVVASSLGFRDKILHVGNEGVAAGGAFFGYDFFALDIATTTVFCKCAAGSRTLKHGRAQQKRKSILSS